MRRLAARSIAILDPASYSAVMQPPAQITPTKLADYLDVLTRAVFQSGISWRVIEAKWPGTREALNEFDPERLADLTVPGHGNVVLDRISCSELDGVVAGVNVLRCRGNDSRRNRWRS